MNECETATPEEDEKRAITLAQLRAMKERGLKLIDLLTVVSGYGQIAMSKEPEAQVQRQLEKMVEAMEKAVESVRLCLDTVEEIWQRRPD
jgi:hypothetical protein